MRENMPCSALSGVRVGGMPERSLLFSESKTKPVIGANSSPRKNHNQAFRLVVCAQYAQRIANKKHASSLLHAAQNGLQRQGTVRTRVMGSIVLLG